MFPTVEDWARGMERLRARFGGTSGSLPVDLLHDNTLTAERQPWLALDPKGVVGEPAYEVGPLLFDAMPHLLNWPQPDRILARRVDQLAEELGFDRARVRGWGLARAVLAACWSTEDQGDSEGWEYFIACAELLAAVRA